MRGAALASTTGGTTVLSVQASYGRCRSVVQMPSGKAHRSMSLHVAGFRAARGRRGGALAALRFRHECLNGGDARRLAAIPVDFGLASERERSYGRRAN